MKSIIRLLKRRRSGGFTLVEMIVSVAVLAVLMVGMILFITPIIRSFNDTNRNMVAENISTCLQTYISSSIRNASKVVIFGNTNDADLKANGLTTVNALRTYCSEKTDDGEYAYILKCISLRFDTTDGRYYMYTEDIPITNTTEPLGTTHTPVFSKCLYNELYTTFDFEKPLDMDKASETPQPVRKDTMQITVKTYSDSSFSNLVFVGTGLTELRQIKKDIAKNQTSSTCEFSIYDGTAATASDSVKFNSSSDVGNRNIYIYYAVRNLSPKTTTP